MRETLVILGSHGGTRDTQGLPVHDLWTFNEFISAGHVAQCDALFQMHLPAIWRNPHNRSDPGHAEWLRQEHNFPIYMLTRFEDVPSSVAYPITEITQKFGSLSRSGEIITYFTSSPCYALALAILVGYKHIIIRGIEMESATEYEHQRAGVYFWIGVAIGQGINVELHPNSALFDAPLYGFEGDAFISAAWLEERFRNFKASELALRDEIKALRSKHEFLVKSLLSQSSDKIHTELQTTGTALELSVIKYGEISGRCYELGRYIEEARAMLSASGDVRFSVQEFELAFNSTRHEDAKRNNEFRDKRGTAVSYWREFTGTRKRERRRAACRRYLLAYGEYLEALGNYHGIHGVQLEAKELFDYSRELVFAAGGEKSKEVLLASRLPSTLHPIKTQAFYKSVPEST